MAYFEAQRAALLQKLQMHWGHTLFRPLQLEAVEATLAGRDLLLILPTGGVLCCLNTNDTIPSGCERGQFTNCSMHVVVPRSNTNDTIPAGLRARPGHEL